MASTHSIKVNEKELPWEDKTTIEMLRDRYKPDADIAIYNGFPVSDNREIKPGDQICFIKRGEHPSEAEMKRLMVARHSPEIYEKIASCTVGIAGAGGLGSSLATALARLSVGRLVIVDFDIVEPSNLNRQQYFIDQIGKLKVNALRENLKRVNPYISIEIDNRRICRANAINVFDKCDVIAECFDNPESKSELTEVILRETNIPIVAVSGIAGHENADKLVCRKIMHRFYLIGDGISAARPGCGLMAPKVGIAAHLQANKILELLLNSE